MQILLARNNFY